MLIRFLSQNDGKLSKRGRAKEFEELTEKENQAIETKYGELFDNVMRNNSGKVQCSKVLSEPQHWRE